jgi:hypothetical protein
MPNLPQDPAARAQIAEMEKIKGNESMRAGDFDVCWGGGGIVGGPNSSF